MMDFSTVLVVMGLALIAFALVGLYCCWADWRKR